MRNTRVFFSLFPTTLIFLLSFLLADLGPALWGLCLFTTYAKELSEIFLRFIYSVLS